MLRVVGKPVVAAARVLAMRLRVKALEPVEPLVLVRVAAAAVALVEADVDHVSFRARIRFA
jgi:hypothetical protein